MSLQAKFSMLEPVLNNRVKTRIIEFSALKGYLTVNDIIKYVESDDLPLDEFERLCDEIISAGVIIRDEDIDIEKKESKDLHLYDKSQLNYDKIYKKVIKIDGSLTWYVEKLKTIEPPQLGEEFLLIHHAKEGNEFAKARLIAMFLKVALRIALWHCEKYKLPLDETIQDANLGLILAVEKFPIERNIRFSTYAPWWIRHYIMRQTQGVSKLFHDIPAHMKEKLVTVIKVKNKHNCLACDGVTLCQHLTREIMVQMNCNIETAGEYLNLLRDPHSIQELQSQNETLLSDNGEAAEEILKKTEKNELRKKVHNVLGMLKEKDRIVIEERFGIFNENPKTLEEVGQKFGVTRERIRQIESKTLKKLSNPKYFGEIRLI